jgi:hypothetical protein
MATESGGHRHGRRRIFLVKLSVIPMLGVQRGLYDMPPGWARFRRYLETMTGGTQDIVLPLGVMNPMGKAHVAAALDGLIALDAEGVAATAAAEAERRLCDLEGDLRVGLVVADDAQGGWTDRYLTETTHRFQDSGEVKRGWTTVLCWTSEEWSADKVRQETLATIYRSLHITRHGVPKTLGQMMTQEGLTAVFAGVQEPVLDIDEMAHARVVMRPHLDSTHFPTAFACLYGDEAARSVGYPPLGLSARAVRCGVRGSTSRRRQPRQGVAGPDSPATNYIGLCVVGAPACRAPRAMGSTVGSPRTTVAHRAFSQLGRQLLGSRDGRLAGVVLADVRGRLAVSRGAIR